VFVIYNNELKLAALDAALESPSALSTIIDKSLPSLLFVKFHKVGGTSIMDLMENKFAQHNKCDGHICSLTAARAMRNATTRSNYDEKLQSDPKTPWVPPGSDLKVFTVLRDPSERLRSKYYFQRSGWCGRKYGDVCPAVRLSFMEWMKYEKDPNDPNIPQDMGSMDAAHEQQACCEYTKTLGDGDLSTALRSLKFFDVVGITERMDETVNEIVRVVNGASEFKAEIGKRRDNTSTKKPWTPEEKKMADWLTRDDRVIYEAALKMADETWGR